jgi:GNAT superfamily N-acetyltransferase
MAPLARAKAEAFWHDVAASVTRGERVLIAANDEHGTIIGAVQVIWAEPENQPHRADVAKMLVTPNARRRGVGAMLLAAAEREAAAHGKTLLVLDTADATAARLYVRGGWTLCGEIPDYALWPNGGYCATQVFFKSLR